MVDHSMGERENDFVWLPLGNEFALSHQHTHQLYSFTLYLILVVCVRVYYCQIYGGGDCLPIERFRDYKCGYLPA